MPIRTTFHKLFKVSQNPAPLFTIRPELLAAVEAIADRENRAPGAVINDLLGYALGKKQSADASLETWHQLTQREREITALVWLGLTNPQIAAHLNISPNTVKTHIKNILSKYTAHSKEELREILSTLDFSDWVDMWIDDTLTRVNSDSPGQANP